MSLNLHVKYDGDQDDRVFLNKDWSIRDVRGFYLRNGTGKLLIPNLLLSQKKHTSIDITFGLSGRSKTERVFVSCNTGSKEYTCYVWKLKQNTVTIILDPIENVFALEILVTAKFSDDADELIHQIFVEECLAIDELCLYR